ncbi:MAG TPA: hypothetical protein VEY71_04870 [Chitinophagales bacterium]|nr:hypothetical protein [Chitinophagales bacterium]
MNQLNVELFGTPTLQLMDPVHGGIRLFDYEQLIIDQPLLQRLRYVRQNDVLYLVFPGATHTRFLHSIGCMHLAGNFYQSLIRSFLGKFSNNVVMEFSDQHKQSILYFYRCVRLAALLHDTGHLPFSHLLEGDANIQKILAHERTFESLWGNDEWKRYYSTKPRHIEHEHLSVRCAHALLSFAVRKAMLPVETPDVIAIMETTDAKTSDVFNTNAATLFSWFQSVGAPISKEDAGSHLLGILRKIISGELDVDKMDYLLRDSFFSGSKYGIYNVDHLLSTIRIGFDTELQHYGLAIEYKGLGALIDFIQSRYQLYTEVYNHKTVVGFKWLLNRAIDCAMQDEKIRLHVTSALSDIDEFEDFTESYFMEQFRCLAKAFPGCAAERILKRQKLTHLLTEEYTGYLNDADNKKNLRKVYGEIVTNDFMAKHSTISLTDYKGLEVLKYNPFQKRYKLKQIKDVTDYFEKFKTKTKFVHYYKDPGLTACVMK